MGYDIEELAVIAGLGSDDPQIAVYPSLLTLEDARAFHARLGELIAVAERGKPDVTDLMDILEGCCTPDATMEEMALAIVRAGYRKAPR